MFASHKSAPNIPAWLVVDARTLTKYGLGMVLPRLPAPLRRKYIDAGYLVTANSRHELAVAIGVDPDGLEQTVAANNRFPNTGTDEEFGKGESVFGHLERERHVRRRR